MKLFLELKVVVVRCFMRKNQVWINLEVAFSPITLKQKNRINCRIFKQEIYPKGRVEIGVLESVRPCAVLMIKEAWM